MKKTATKKAALIPLGIAVIVMLCISQWAIPNLKRTIPKSIDFISVRASFKNPNSYRTVWVRLGHEGIGGYSFIHESGPFMYGSQQPLPNKN